MIELIFFAPELTETTRFLWDCELFGDHIAFQSKEKEWHTLTKF